MFRSSFCHYPGILHKTNVDITPGEHLNILFHHGGINQVDFMAPPTPHHTVLFCLQVSKMACVESGAVAKGEMKVASMVILMVLTFLVSWLPYAGLAMLVVYYPEMEIHPLVGTVPVYLAKSSTVYNPIIYIYLNKQVL